MDKRVRHNNACFLTRVSRIRASSQANGFTKNSEMIHTMSVDFSPNREPKFNFNIEAEIWLKSWSQTLTGLEVMAWARGGGPLWKLKLDLNIEAEI